MTSRRRSIRALTLGIAASLAVAAPATAAPRVTEVDGFRFVDSDGRSDYVVLDVRTSGASEVRVTWRGQGGAVQRVRSGRAGVGFARRGVRSYRVSVRACRRGRCSRVRRFSGTFQTIRTSTDPRPNSSPPDGGPSNAAPDPLSPVPQIPLPTPPTSNPTSPGATPSAPSG